MASRESEVDPASDDRVVVESARGAGLHRGIDRALLLAVQRGAGNRAASALVQRAVATTKGRVQLIQRYRLKPKLESEDLDVQRLQEAVSSADKALNAGADEGDAVTRLQSALRKLKYDAPFTGKFDAETQRAVAKFQTDQGIPYPTGRQAGPKTLSALDDALLGASPENRKRCAQYEPGEREKSFKTPGRTAEHGSFGESLYLYNFASSQSRMKKEHEEAVLAFIRKFDLADPNSAWEIEFIRGFTDSVDAEDRNWVLREARADDVQWFLKQHGVPSAPGGQAADVSSYDNGCDPFGRSNARRVIVQLRKSGKKPPPDPPPKPEPEPDVPGGACKTKPSRRWALRGNGSVAPSKMLAAAGAWNFTLTDRESGQSRVLTFRGAGGSLGASFPATAGIDNPTDFDSERKLYFEDFEGGGGLYYGEIGFVVGYAAGRAVLHPRTIPSQVSISGFQLGAGVDVTYVAGNWFYDPVLGGGCFKAPPGVG